MNAVAGGGTFLTFPALVFTGLPSVAANQTSSIAVFPGQVASFWAYRNILAAKKTDGLNVRRDVVGADLRAARREEPFLLCESGRLGARFTKEPIRSTAF